MKGQNDTSDIRFEGVVVPERVQDCHCLVVKDEKTQPGPTNVLMSQTRLARNGFAQRFDAQAPPVLGCAPWEVWGRKGGGGVSTRQQGGYCRMTWASMQQRMAVVPGSYNGSWARAGVGQAKEGEESGLVCSELHTESSSVLEGRWKDEAVTVEA